MTQAATFGRRGASPPPKPIRSLAPRQTPDAPPSALISVDGGAERTVLQYVAWLLFSFKGRLRLAGYRNMRLAANVILLLIVYAIRPTGSAGALAMQGLVLIGTSVLYFWTTLAMQVKRWHDRDKSWFWLFVGFIPFVGPWWVLIETNWLKGSPGYNRFDEPSKTVAATFS